MRSVKYILSAALIILLLLVCASCGGNENGGTSASSSSTSATASQYDPYAELEVFDGDSGKTAEGFGAFGEGEITLENGCLKIENGMGAFHVEDSGLSLNPDRFKILSISFDLTFESFPASNGMAIISPLFWIEGNIKYQVFLRVDSKGKLGYHANGRWIQDVIVDGDPLYIKEGVEYGVEIIYDIEYGSYSIYLDGDLIEDDILEYMMDETVTRFTIRFLDNNTANGPCSVILKNLKIEARP